MIGGNLTLASARRLAAKLQHDIAQGRDPAAEYLAKKRGSSGPGDTFAAAAREYIEHARRATRRWQETAAVLGLKPNGHGSVDAIPCGLCERWRDTPVDEVDEDAVVKVIDEARRKGVPGLERRNAEPSEARARALFSALSVMFNWLRERRRVRTSPLAALKRPATPRSRERVLSDAEIAKFWEATAKIGEPFASALRIMLVTGARRDEVSGMRRGELNAELSAWTLPAGRTKNKREHAVPLPPLARQIIKAVPSVGDEFVFTTTGRSPISGWSKTKKRLDLLMGEMPPWRIHDLRRTAVTGMARAGADLAVIERAVNHVSGSFGGIVGVYQKHKFADEVRTALEAWANLLVEIVEERPANVVLLRHGGP